MKNSNNRKKLLINKNFQLKFILYTLLPTMISQVILWVGLDLFLNKMADKGKAANLPPDHFFYRLIDEQTDLMRSLFLTVGGVSILIVVIWALFISHKIAGPFYRLTKMLENRDNSLSNIRFRPGDFFPEVAEALSKYLKNRS